MAPGKGARARKLLKRKEKFAARKEERLARVEARTTEPGKGKRNRSGAGAKAKAMKKMKARVAFLRKKGASEDETGDIDPGDIQTEDVNPEDPINNNDDDDDDDDDDMDMDESSSEIVGLPAGDTTLPPKLCSDVPPSSNPSSLKSLARICPPISSTVTFQAELPTLEKEGESTADSEWDQGVGSRPHGP